jgi:hypothetical protein
MSITGPDPDEIVFHLGLTRAQMKVTHTALRSLIDDFGREQRDVAAIVREVLEKLPGETDMRSIDLAVEIERRRAARAA